MTTKQERSDAHWKKKELLKREIDGYFSEIMDQHLIRVSFGYGSDNDVMLASNIYILDMCDVLMLVDAHVSEKYIALKEERKGFIGTASYRKIKYEMSFQVRNQELAEEVANLIEEENWSEIEKLFGGN